MTFREALAGDIPSSEGKKLQSQIAFEYLKQLLLSTAKQGEFSFSCGKTNYTREEKFVYSVRGLDKNNVVFDEDGYPVILDEGYVLTLENVTDFVNSNEGLKLTSMGDLLVIEILGKSPYFKLAIDSKAINKISGKLEKICKEFANYGKLVVPISNMDYRTVRMWASRNGFSSFDNEDGTIEIHLAGEGLEFAKDRREVRSFLIEETLTQLCEDTVNEGKLFAKLGTLSNYTATPSLGQVFWKDNQYFKLKDGTYLLKADVENWLLFQKGMEFTAIKDFGASVFGISLEGHSQYLKKAKKAIIQNFENIAGLCYQSGNTCVYFNLEEKFELEVLRQWCQENLFTLYVTKKQTEKIVSCKVEFNL